MLAFCYASLFICLVRISKRNAVLRSFDLSFLCVYHMLICTCTTTAVQYQPHNLLFDERRLRLIHYAWNVVLKVSPVYRCTATHIASIAIVIHCVPELSICIYSSRKLVVVFATTDNFRTNNLLFYFAISSQPGSHYSTPQRKAFAFSLTYSLAHCDCVQWK